MVKKRGGGIPYLKTNLKFSWDSSSNLSSSEIDDLLGQLGEHLVQHGLSSESIPSTSNENATTTRKRRRVSPSDKQNEYGFIGLNSVFSSMSSGDAVCVLFDSSVLKATAVSSVVGLYAHSCSSTTTSFALPRLDETLSPLLNRRGTEAIALTIKSSSLCDVLKEKLVPLTIEGGKSNENTRTTLDAPSTEISIGKINEKKNKQKGRNHGK